MEERIEILRHCPVLKGFTEEELAGIAAVGREKLYSNAQSFQVQGEPPRDRGVIFIGTGRARCEVTDSDGKVFGLGTLGPGDHLGGMRFYAESASPVSVVAEGDVTFLLIDREAFATLRKDAPPVAMKLLFTLTENFGTLLSASGTLFADFAQFAARKVNFAERGNFGNYTDFGLDLNALGSMPPKSTH